MKSIILYSSPDSAPDRQRLETVVGSHQALWIRTEAVDDEPHAALDRARPRADETVLNAVEARTEPDWAQRLCREIQELPLPLQHQAMRQFLNCFGDGAVVPNAYRSYREAAVGKYYRHFASGKLMLVFADGSYYAAWKEGLKRFGPDATAFLMAELNQDDQH